MRIVPAPDRSRSDHAKVRRAPAEAHRLVNGGPRGAWTVLVVDGVGCVAASVLVSMPAVYRLLDPALKTQGVVRASLLVTGGAFLTGAIVAPRRTLRFAAVLNAGWVGVWLWALPRQRGAVGRAVVAGTAVLDAAAGLTQWHLSRKADASPKARSGHAVTR